MCVSCGCIAAACQLTATISHRWNDMHQHAAAITEHVDKLVRESVLNHEGLHQILSVLIHADFYTGAGILKLRV